MSGENILADRIHQAIGVRPGACRRGNIQLDERPEYNSQVSQQVPKQGPQLVRFVTLCGRTFHNTDPRYFPSAEYRGRILYFCTQSCLGAFRADPARFYAAHRRSAHKPAPLLRLPR